MPSDPVIANTIDANFHKLRAIVSREPRTSEELAVLMGLDINVVRLLIHCSGEYHKVRLGNAPKDDKWVWKGFSK